MHRNRQCEILRALARATGQESPSGKPVPSEALRRMERALQYDFSDVRIHVGPKAETMGASAFACGSNLCFAEGMYDPWSKEGRFLLAHELVHVIQQREGRAAGHGREYSVVQDRGLELEADVLAGLAVNGISVPAGAAGDSLRPDPGAPVIQCMIYGTKSGFPTRIPSLENARKEIKSSIEDRYKREDADSLLSGPVTKKLLKEYLDDDFQHLVEDIADMLVGGGNDKRWTESRKLRKMKKITKFNYDDLIFKSQLTRKGSVELRYKELQGMGGTLWLAEQYGLQTVKIKGQGDLEDEKPLGISFLNKYSSLYMRTEPGPYEHLANLIWYRLEQKEEFKKNFFADPKQFEYLKVNSDELLRRKLKSLDFSNTCTDPAKPLTRLYPCIYIMGVKKANSDKDRQDLKEFLKWLGAGPSVYQAIRACYREEKAVLPTGEKTDNSKSVTDFLESDEFKELKEIGETRQETDAVLFMIVYELLSGLKNLPWETTDNFNTSSVAESALNNIDDFVKMFLTARNDLLDRSRLFELIANELYMILAIPEGLYTNEDFEKTIKDIYTERAPSLKGKDTEIEVCLESSGMGALSTAIAAAVSDSGTTGCEVEYISEDYQYFELKDFLKKVKLKPGNNRILLTSLNPSTPTKKENIVTTIGARVDKVLGEKQKDGKVTLIIDITLETDEGEDGTLNEIIEKEKPFLTEGRLNIFLVKSFQKYASLGLPKIMSGTVIAIYGNGQSKNFPESVGFIESVKKEKYVELDENRLMLYLLRNAAAFEIELVKKASSNAESVSDSWSSKATGFTGYMEDLPFVMRRIPRFSGADDEEKYGKRLLAALGFEFRESFGFLNSSYLYITQTIRYQRLNLYRFTTGLETRARLEEKFFGLSVMSEVRSNYEIDITPGSESKDMNEVFKELFKRYQKKGLSGSRKASVLNILYILCSIIRDDPQGKVLPMYEDFVDKEDEFKSLSSEMQGDLVVNWLRLKMCVGKGEAKLEGEGWETEDQKSERIKKGMEENLKFVREKKEDIRRRSDEIPAYRKVLFLMNDVPEELFYKAEGTKKKDLTDKDRKEVENFVVLMLTGIDWETLVRVFWDVAGTQNYYKADYIRSAMVKCATVYSLPPPDDKIKEIEELEKEKKLPEGLAGVIRKEEPHTFDSVRLFLDRIDGIIRQVKLGDLDRYTVEAKIIKRSRKSLSDTGLLEDDVTKDMFRKKLEEVKKTVLGEIEEEKEMFDKYGADTFSETTDSTTLGKVGDTIQFLTEKESYVNGFGNWYKGKYETDDLCK